MNISWIWIYIQSKIRLSEHFFANQLEKRFGLSLLGNQITLLSVQLPWSLRKTQKLHAFMWQPSSEQTDAKLYNTEE